MSVEFSCRESFELGMPCTTAGCRFPSEHYGEAVTPTGITGTVLQLSFSPPWMEQVPLRTQMNTCKAHFSFLRGLLSACFQKTPSIGVETACIIVNCPMPLSRLSVNLLFLLENFKSSAGRLQLGRPVLALFTQEDLVLVLTLLLIICGIMCKSLL